jgi:hypothetical protein
MRTLDRSILLPEFYLIHEKDKLPMTHRALLAGVLDGTLFGGLEVDIRVPERWLPGGFKHNLSPYEYFEEMSPIFATTDVHITKDVIGEHMMGRGV